MKEIHGKYALLAPAVGVIVALFAYPLVYALILSFRQWNLAYQSEPGPFIGLDNYREALADARFLNSLKVTGIIVGINMILAPLIAFPIGLLIVNSPGRLARIARLVMILPFAISPLLAAVSWRYMLNPSFGILDWFSRVILGPFAPNPWLGDTFSSFVAIMLLDLWRWVPFLSILFVAGIASLPKEPVEAGIVDGASSWQVVKFLIVPMMRPVIVSAILLKFMFTLKIFDHVYVLTGGGPAHSTESIVFYIHQVAFSYWKLSYASALAYILVSGLAIITFLYIKKTQET